MIKKREKAKTKSEVFKKFSIWINLPVHFLGRGAEELEKVGIDDPTYQELIAIKNRADFSRKFKVSQKTLSLWSKEVPTHEADQNMHGFFKEFTKTLLMSFVRQQIKHPTPQGLVTWYEIVKGRTF